MRRMIEGEQSIGEISPLQNFLLSPGLKAKIVEGRAVSLPN